MAAKTSLVTTDHETIRRWAEERGAHPARVKGTGGKDDVGIIRLDFPGYSGEDTLEPISWDDFFKEFDKKGLALVYEETTASGAKSNFNKLVSRESVEASGKASKSDSGNASRKGASKKETSTRSSRSAAHK
jgi:hypothetical protein